MRFLFWNIRGMGKASRRRQLKEMVYKEKFDVIGVQETIKKDFLTRELSSLVGGDDFIWHWVSAHGHSGGLLMGIKTSCWRLKIEIKGEFLSVCLLDIREVTSDGRLLTFMALPIIR